MGNPPTPAPSPSYITERYAAVYYRSGDIVGGKKRSEGEREGRGGECGKEEMVVKRANAVERGKRDGHMEREEERTARWERKRREANVEGDREEYAEWEGNQSSRRLKRCARARRLFYDGCMCAYGARVCVSRVHGTG